MDRKGNSEVKDFLYDLREKAKYDKDARINIEKISSHILALEKAGTRIGSPIVKHIDGELWELRPLKNRIFFFYWKSNKFILVHYFVKKTNKTPKKEIKKAISRIKDYKERFGDC